MVLTEINPLILFEFFVFALFSFSFVNHFINNNMLFYACYLKEVKE